MRPAPGLQSILNATTLASVSILAPQLRFHFEKTIILQIGVHRVRESHEPGLASRGVIAVPFTTSAADFFYWEPHRPFLILRLEQPTRRRAKYE